MRTHIFFFFLLDQNVSAIFSVLVFTRLLCNTVSLFASSIINGISLLNSILSDIYSHTNEASRLFALCKFFLCVYSNVDVNRRIIIDTKTYSKRVCVYNIVHSVHKIQHFPNICHALFTHSI